MTTFETLAEIAAVTSLLIKFGFDNIIEDDSLFIAYLAELGFSYKGRPLSRYTLERLKDDLTPIEKEKLVNEFNKGHEPINRQIAMRTNFARLA